MSFYQPSLSLYDILNALSEQTQQGNDAAQPVEGHGHHGHRHHPHNGSGRSTRGQLAGAGREERLYHPTMGTTMYPTPFSDVYSVPEGYYYTPQFFSDSENAEEDEEDLNEALNEGATSTATGAEGEDKGKGKDTGKDKDTTEESNKKETMEVPSYYYGQRNTPGKTDDDFSSLLCSLLGVAPPSKTEDEEGTKTEKKTDEGAKKDQVELDTASSGIPEDSLNAKPALKKKSSSFTHKPTSTVSRSEPLQVSKPESSLQLPFSPNVNVYDTDENYIVVFALPGSNSKEFHVDYHPLSNELLVKGGVEDKSGFTEKNLKVMELKYGSFERTIKFPVLPRVKDDEIKATYSNGLLQIKVPKVLDSEEEVKPRKRIVIEDVPDESLDFENVPAS